MANKYWETEKPVQVIAGKTFLIHYPENGKLQIASSFRNDEGELVPGKRGTLDLEALATTPEAIEILEKFIQETKEMGA